MTEFAVESRVVCLWGAVILPFFLLFPTAGGAEAESTARQERFYLWWHPGVARRVEGGWIRQPLMLRMTGPSIPEGSVDVFIRTTPMGRFGGDGSDEPPPLWWRVEAAAESEQAYSVDIIGGASFRVVVFGRTRVDDTEHWAVAHFNLYGGAVDPAIRDGIVLEAPPTPPAFGLTSDGEGYWPQTGHCFTLRPDWPGMEALAAMTVHDEYGRELARLPRTAEGGFAYRPPHDKALDRAGDIAAKPFIFVADAPGGIGTISYTLAVHRSRWANYRLIPGLGVLAGSMAATGVFVWRRRRGDPWYGR